MILGVNKRQLTTARSCSCDVGRMRYQPTAMSGTGESGRLAQPSAGVKFLATRRAARKPIFLEKGKKLGKHSLLYQIWVSKLSY